MQLFSSDRNDTAQEYHSRNASRFKKTEETRFEAWYLCRRKQHKTCGRQGDIFVPKVTKFSFSMKKGSYFVGGAWGGKAVAASSFVRGHKITNFWLFFQYLRPPVRAKFPPFCGIICSLHFRHIFTPPRDCCCTKSHNFLGS